ncbi:MAG: ATP-dependent RNA helicase HrpA [Gammaproteobacteria bacterium]|nr:ATP-dependent RNA helicase HrpA [Gammaproteobacteria bacterium]
MNDPSSQVSAEPLAGVAQTLPKIEAYMARLEHCMLGDRGYFARELERARRQITRGKAHGASPHLVRLFAKIDNSLAVVRARAEYLAVPQVSEGLPISECADEILRTIADHQVTILCGDTGSGKTTQLPKLCMRLGRGTHAWIGHTQPRRIAARSVAARIASEVGANLGAVVGYKVRFDERLSDVTRVKVMTDGILLAEVSHDKWLQRYDTIIIDEAHERSLNIDLLLGYFHRILPRRPDLKLIVTSATIDHERLAEHFVGAALVEIPGRSYPVEVRHLDPDIELLPAPDRDLSEEVRDAVKSIVHEVSGDVLVFLPGERDIRETSDRVRGDGSLDVEVLPLYARLNASQQERIFKAHKKQRVILSTNVAETSLTVPNIHAVIDTGLARISRYSTKTKVQRLPVEFISQASATQRQGRCGRVAPGICMRLYTEEQFDGLRAYTEPEIRRTNLASVILQMHAAKLGRLEGFPFLDAPNNKYVRDGYRLLRELGALDANDRLTPLGQRLARLPVDPRIGRMIIAAGEGQCAREVLAIAAALSVGDPRDRPFEAKAKAEIAHGELRDPRSDFMTLLKIWELFRTEGGTARGLKALCKTHFLSFRRMMEWRDVHRQLVIVAREIGVRSRREPASLATIHRALLTGLLSFVGVHDKRREYRGVRDSRFLIAKGSGVRAGRWVVAAELVETNALYAHTAAKVRPEWIEQAAGDLAQIELFEPYWDERRGEVMAFERVTLFGLTIIAKRRIRYAPRDPETARRLFIREALVAGRYGWQPDFRRHNDALLAHTKALEARARRTDLVADDETLAEFYERVLPKDVASLRGLKQWYAALDATEQGRLRLTRSDVTRRGAPPVEQEEYPDQLEAEGYRFSIDYRFEAGATDDGISVKVPLGLMHLLGPHAFDWLVPGYLRMKVEAVLRALPKQERRRAVPIPDTVSRFLASHIPRGSLREALAIWLNKTFNVDPVSVHAAELPDHLHARVEVIHGKQVRDVDRDVAALHSRLAAQAERQFRAIADAAFEKRGLTSWRFGELPLEQSVRIGAHQCTLYPGLSDARSSVSLQLFETRADASRNTQRGVRRLFLLQMGRELSDLRRNLPDYNTLSLQYLLVPSVESETEEDLSASLIGCAVDNVLMTSPPQRWTEAEFRRRSVNAVERVREVCHQLCEVTREVMNEFSALREMREALSNRGFDESLSDVDGQLASLVYKGFVGATPAEMFGQLPRYLLALRHRLEKLPSRPQRDLEASRAVATLWRQWVTHPSAEEPEMIAFRWRLEELRVSLFAQELGTRFSVSVPRLEREWETLTAQYPTASGTVSGNVRAPAT